MKFHIEELIVCSIEQKGNYISAGTVVLHGYALRLFYRDTKFIHS